MIVVKVRQFQIANYYSNLLKIKHGIRSSESINLKTKEEKKTKILKKTQLKEKNVNFESGI
jgi:hypothetical protein